MKEKKKGRVKNDRSVLGWVSREDEEWVKGEGTVSRESIHCSKGRRGGEGVWVKGIGNTCRCEWKKHLRVSGEYDRLFLTFQIP